MTKNAICQTIALIMFYIQQLYPVMKGVYRQLIMSKPHHETVGFRQIDNKRKMNDNLLFHAFLVPTH